MTFGTPTGSARIAAVASDVPPEPPAEMTPARSRRVSTKRSRASAIALTADPRSPVNTARAPCGWCRATSPGPTSAGDGRCVVATSTVIARMPEPLEAALDERELASLRVEGADDVSAAPDHRGDRNHRGRGGTRLGRGFGRRRRGFVRARPGRPRGRRVGPGIRLEALERRSLRRLGGSAPHLEHLRLLRARRRRRDVGLELLGAVGRAHAEEPLLQIAVGAQLGGARLVRDPAVDQHEDAVGHGGGHAEVLLDQQHRDRPLGGEVLEHRHHLVDDDRREALGRLVHDEEPRVGEQRARDREHLLLAAGELRTAVRLALREPRERRVRALTVHGSPLRSPARGGAPRAAGARPR